MTQTLEIKLGYVRALAELKLLDRSAVPGFDSFRAVNAICLQRMVGCPTILQSIAEGRCLICSILKAKPIAMTGKTPAVK